MILIIMRDTDLFQLALGLTRPWYVSSCEFDVSKHRLDIEIDFPRGGTFACPSCGREGCSAYDTERHEWRHLNFFQHEAYLAARVPRVNCVDCGIKTMEVPWARSGSGFTLLFEALIMMMAKAMPVKSIADIVKEHDTRLWRVLTHYVHESRQESDFSAVAQVGVDETSNKRGHNKYPPAEPEILRLLAPQRGLTAIGESQNRSLCIVATLTSIVPMN